MTDLDIHRSTTVGAPIFRAFEVFTAHMTSWWPAANHVAAKPFVDAIVEPRVGGRWFERDAEGTECEWGRVLVWEPPTHLVLGWHLQPDGSFVDDPQRASTVDIVFTALGPDNTRVDVTHRDLESHGANGATMSAMVGSDQGWSGILAHFRQALTP